MEGNENIDALMMPVLDAIRRHVKDKDAITDIYNRAYEAIQNSMGVNEPSMFEGSDPQSIAASILGSIKQKRRLNHPQKMERRVEGLQDNPNVKYNLCYNNHMIVYILVIYLAILVGVLIREDRPPMNGRGAW